jgi:hypothetical protein
MVVPFELAFRSLVDEYRARCLWFLRADYYPDTVVERARVLDAIAAHGDALAFRRVAELRTWLSRTSSDASATSRSGHQ